METRSNRDKTLFVAHYYCFVAGAIVTLLPLDRQQGIALESFGKHGRLQGGREDRVAALPAARARRSK